MRDTNTLLAVLAGGIHRPYGVLKSSLYFTSTKSSVTAGQPKSFGSSLRAVTIEADSDTAAAALPSGFSVLLRNSLVEREAQAAVQAQTPSNFSVVLRDVVVTETVLDPGPAIGVPESFSVNLATVLIRTDTSEDIAGQLPTNFSVVLSS